jgi:hypothetical protein
MEGYSKISSRIACHPELGIYRGFKTLNAQNILYLQAEIHELEADLQQYADEDAKAPKTSARSQYSRNWHKLANSPDDRRQWNTFCALREKLKEYNDCLVQQALISKHYRDPRDYDLDVLKTCLTHQNFPDFLLGKDSTIWEDKELAHDLVTLGANGADDGFTVWMANHVVQPFHELIGRHIKKPSADFEGMTDYSDQMIARLASLVVTVISSVFPIVGVIILYFVKDLLARIGIIAGLTALFSLCLALVTDARRGEIFAATAA